MTLSTRHQRRLLSEGRTEGGGEAFCSRPRLRGGCGRRRCQGTTTPRAARTSSSRKRDHRLPRQTIGDATSPFRTRPLGPKHQPIAISQRVPSYTVSRTTSRGSTPQTRSRLRLGEEGGDVRYRGPDLARRANRAAGHCGRGARGEPLEGKNRMLGIARGVSRPARSIANGRPPRALAPMQESHARSRRGPVGGGLAVVPRRKVSVATGWVAKARKNTAGLLRRGLSGHGDSNERQRTKARPADRGQGDYWLGGGLVARCERGAAEEEAGGGEGREERPRRAARASEPEAVNPASEWGGKCRLCESEAVGSPRGLEQSTKPGRGARLNVMNPKHAGIPTEACRDLEGRSLPRPIVRDHSPGPFRKHRGNKNKNKKTEKNRR